MTTKTDDFDLSDKELNEIFFEEKSTTVSHKLKKASKKRKTKWKNPEFLAKEKVKEDAKSDMALSTGRLGYYEQRKIVREIKENVNAKADELKKEIQMTESLDRMIIYADTCNHFDVFDYIDIDGAFHSKCKKCSRDKIWQGSEWVIYNKKINQQRDV